MRLDAKKVNEILLDALFRDGEIVDGKVPENAVFSEGIMRKMGFHKERLESHRQEIAEMCAELPDQFQKEKGGGYTFLNGCMDREGRQWGEQINVDELVILAQALGIGKYLLPREAWSACPGGVPYFVVGLDGEAMSEETKCGLCGEPMPEGEEMFKYHGYSGPCPKPPLARPQKREIQYVEVMGKHIAAYLVICPICKTLDLNTDFSPGGNLRDLIAECPLGHKWAITREQIDGA